ncbi:ArnT family glycosyltransferase [Tundrisphaera sp. TA3]|uniref:ArnT family glycosyltransferase n=1 Tax=Tundrisphaera sp. TA3 TaxID=3435775 RepID=UPI003EC03587
MDTIVTPRRGMDGRIGLDAPGTPGRPLLRPAPRSAMFFPLVVLMAVLPGLYALNWWNLTPPGPWWGLRGLAVLDGWFLDQTPAADSLRPALESRAFRAVALQPPLYAWLEALGLSLGHARAPWATVMPSYIAGAAIVLLVYWHGRLWRGPGVGLAAAMLTAFNPHILIQMKVASPATLALAATLTSLYCYGRHLQLGPSPSRFFVCGGGAAWILAGGVSLGLSLLAMGGVGLLCVPVVVLHQTYLRSGLAPVERAERPWYGWWNNPSLVAGAVALVIGLVIAAPWYGLMYAAHGREFLGSLLVPPDPLGWERPALLSRLNDLAPATLPLGLFAVARAIREALVSDGDDRGTVGGILWVVWLAVAALAPAAWVGGPQTAMGLFLLVPLNLLAAQAMSDLAGRRAPVRALSWLAPATAVSVAWWVSGELRGAVIGLTHGHVGLRSALGLHLAVDLLIVVVWLSRGLDRWARRRDVRQRRVLASFLGVVLVTTLADGLREVTFRHFETRELMNLRSSVLMRHRVRPFRSILVVGPDFDRPLIAGPTPGGRLRFVLRSTLPGVPELDLTSSEQLLGVTEAEEPRLVVLVGEAHRLSYAAQSQLGLESIHPGRLGLLDAFASTVESPRSKSALR